MTIQLINNIIILRKDVSNKLLEQLTFPSSFSIPEGKEVGFLSKFIEDLIEIVEVALDNFEDPLEVPDTLPTEGNETKEDKLVKFSIEDNFTQENVYID